MLSRYAGYRSALKRVGWRSAKNGGCNGKERASTERPAPMAAKARSDTESEASREWHRTVCDLAEDVCLDAHQTTSDTLRPGCCGELHAWEPHKMETAQEYKERIIQALGDRMVDGKTPRRGPGEPVALALHPHFVAESAAERDVPVQALGILVFADGKKLCFDMRLDAEAMRDGVERLLRQRALFSSNVPDCMNCGRPIVYAHSPCTACRGKMCASCIERRMRSACTVEDSMQCPAAGCTHEMTISETFGGVQAMVAQEFESPRKAISACLAAMAVTQSYAFVVTENKGAMCLVKQASYGIGRDTRQQHHGISFVCDRSDNAVLREGLAERGMPVKIVLTCVGSSRGRVLLRTERAGPVGELCGVLRLCKALAQRVCADISGDTVVEEM